MCLFVRREAGRVQDTRQEDADDKRKRFTSSLVLGNRDSETVFKDELEVERY